MEKSKLCRVQTNILKLHVAKVEDKLAIFTCKGLTTGSDALMDHLLQSHVICLLSGSLKFRYFVDSGRNLPACPANTDTRKSLHSGQKGTLKTSWSTPSPLKVPRLPLSVALPGQSYLIPLKPPCSLLKTQYPHSLKWSSLASI